MSGNDEPKLQLIKSNETEEQKTKYSNDNLTNKQIEDENLLSAPYAEHKKMIRKVRQSCDISKLESRLHGSAWGFAGLRGTHREHTPYVGDMPDLTSQEVYSKLEKAAIAIHKVYQGANRYFEYQSPKHTRDEEIKTAFDDVLLPYMQRMGFPSESNTKHWRLDTKREGLTITHNGGIRVYPEAPVTDVFVGQFTFCFEETIHPIAYLIGKGCHTIPMMEIIRDAFSGDENNLPKFLQTKKTPYFKKGEKTRHILPDEKQLNMDPVEINGELIGFKIEPTQSIVYAVRLIREMGREMTPVIEELGKLYKDKQRMLTVNGAECGTAIKDYSNLLKQTALELTMLT